jgi:hypothetical protein
MNAGVLAVMAPISDMHGPKFRTPWLLEQLIEQIARTS